MIYGFGRDGQGKNAFMRRMLSVMLLCRSTPSPRRAHTIPKWVRLKSSAFWLPLLPSKVVK